MDTSPIRTSEQVDKILPALAAMRRELKPIIKDTPNPAFRGVMYAPLPKVLEVVEPLLERHGLLLTQWMADAGPGRAAVAARVWHVESGQWIECVAATDVAKHDPQGVGGGYSYLRRYTLGGLGVITEVDDDGNGASGPVHGQRADVPRGDSRGASYDRSPRPAPAKAAARPNNGRAADDDIGF